MRYLTLIFALFSFVASFKSYHEHTVLRTEKLSMEKTQILRDLQVRTNLDFWRDAYPGQAADIMVSDRDMAGLKDFLEKNNIESSVMVEDVQSLIEETRPRNMSAKGTMDWDDYYPHEDLVAFIQGLADTNADWARIINIGQTYEGRDMNVLAIEKAGPGAPNVWLEAGIHAREWIAPAVATYLVNELVNNNDAHPDYLDKINWYFLPCANPDGYSYSWETDRMWRKTRSPQGGCFGVDPNRNWDYHWGETGVSSNPCSPSLSCPSASTPTPSSSCGPTAMTTTHTQTTTRRSSSWPLTPATPSTPSTAPSLSPSTLLTSTLPPARRMTGTGACSAPASPSPQSLGTLATTGSSCPPPRSSPRARRCGPASRWRSTDCSVSK